MKSLIMLVSLASILLISACGLNDETPVESPPEENGVEVEEEVEIEEPTVEKEDEISFSQVLEDFQVLTSFETDGPGTGLGLGMTVLHQEENSVLISGHQGHALAHYRLLQVNHDDNKVLITHQYSEEQYEKFEEIQRMITEDGTEAAFAWVENEEPNFNELFFATELPPVTANVSWNDQEWEAIEVEIKDGDEKYIFAKGKGLIQIHYQSELAQEIFGEIRVANRIVE